MPRLHVVWGSKSPCALGSFSAFNEGLMIWPPTGFASLQVPSGIVYCEFTFYTSLPRSSLLIISVLLMVLFHVVQTPVTDLKDTPNFRTLLNTCTICIVLNKLTERSSLPIISRCCYWCSLMADIHVRTLLSHSLKIEVEYLWTLTLCKWTYRDPFINHPTVVVMVSIYKWMKQTSLTLVTY